MRTNADTATATLKFANPGRVTAVFHVCDKLHLDRLPQQRHVVEPGKPLHGDRAARADDGGKYDLRVPGPNGRHRRFTGDLSRLVGAPRRHASHRVSPPVPARPRTPVARRHGRRPIRLKRPPGMAQTSEGSVVQPSFHRTKMLRLAARSR